MSSVRARKASALKALRERRMGISTGPRTEEYEAHEDDVYEEVDEAEYRDLVRRRREREDFVVNNGKISCAVSHSIQYHCRVGILT